MQYQALYRKYRPKNFLEVVDQEYIVKILINSLKSESISHAYIFSGPRGTGKTTLAKLLAKSVNCLNLKDGLLCDTCESCLSINGNYNMDVIEMDAASNNSVDEIRELRSKVSLVPASSKYKIYIIDEVHMLTTSAFNALLKTLEEPPKHVIFILATTELHKVPSTILSRCQCFEFRRISLDNLFKKLRQVADLEKISVDNEVLKEIALYSEGGMRDALGMLDKLSSYTSEKIDLNYFLSLNNLVSNQELESFIEEIFRVNNKYIIEKLSMYEASGIDILKFIERLIYKLRDMITDQYINSKRESIKEKFLTDLALSLNDCYIKMHNSISPKIILELELLLFMSKITNCNSAVRDDSTDSQKEKDVGNAKQLKQMFDQVNKETRVNNAFAKADKEILNNLKIKWNDSLQEFVLDSNYGAAACILIDSIPRVASDEYLIVSVKYGSILENINFDLNLFQELVEEVFKKKFKLALITESEWDKAREQFIKKKKSGEEYIYQEEKIDDSVKKAVSYGKINHRDDSNLTEIINLVGEDVVEIE